MVLWSLAALQYRSDALLSAFAAELLRPERVAGLSPQDLANTLWAYSRRDIFDFLGVYFCVVVDCLAILLFWIFLLFLLIFICHNFYYMPCIP